MIIVFDFLAGYEVFRIQSQNAILSVDLSFSGERLAMCESKRIRVFHVQSGAPIYEKTSTDRPRAVKLSLDGKKVAAGIDGKLQVRRVDDGAHYHTFDKIASPVCTMSIDREGTVVAMGCEDGKLAVFLLSEIDETGSPQWTAQLVKKVCTVVSPDGAFVAAGDHADNVSVFAAKTGELLWSKTSWGGKGAPFTSSLSFAGDSSLLAIGRWDACAYLLQTNSWEIIATAKRKDSVYSVSLDHLGKRMAMSGRDKKAQVFAVDVARHAGCGASAKLDLIFSAQLECVVNSVAMTRDGKLLAAGCMDAFVHIYLVNTKVNTVSRISRTYISHLPPVLASPITDPALSSHLPPVLASPITDPALSSTNLPSPVPSPVKPLPPPPPPPLCACCFLCFFFCSAASEPHHTSWRERAVCLIFGRRQPSRSCWRAQQSERLGVVGGRSARSSACIAAPGPGHECRFLQGEPLLCLWSPRHDIRERERKS